MIAVDTNILVRLLVNDASALVQIASAKALLKEARHVFVPQIVQVELVWVLESAYGFDKAAVVGALRHLQQSVIFVLQEPAQFDAALVYFENNPADFSDYLIVSACLEHNHQLYTFDKKLARLHAVNLLAK